MIHIVFNESEVDLMKQVIEQDETLAGEVIQIKDDFAVGPLTALETEEGWQARYNWWMGLLEGSHYAGTNQVKFDDRETVKTIKEKLANEPAEQLWIWMGQNQHDVSGYYWLMSQMSEFAGRVMVLYLNNLPFINEKGQIFYPSWLSEIQPKEFLKAKKLARPITLSEFEVDPDEWRKLCEENGLVRILEGGKKIASKDETFYDAEIIKNLTGEWQKATRVLTNTLHRMKIKTGDVFLMWRMKQLISEGKIEVTGDVNKGWKDFDVKLAGAKGKEEVVSETKEAEG
ncbi:DUF1835 domain-containing protein [Terrimonas pollutisoli]|uniref:DUF1835 domain-containing protein n=1 Tax=Terrimonas pollutisoli TaxID=3034147 RepID=UPI0023ED03D1|nr:DUF1835 domain-containing protein [Terrimonas sp. H1YJ31]